jgi:hypothetical protein
VLLHGWAQDIGRLLREPVDVISASALMHEVYSYGGAYSGLHTLMRALTIAGPTVTSSTATSTPSPHRACMSVSYSPTVHNPGCSSGACSSRSLRPPDGRCDHQQR